MIDPEKIRDKSLDLGFSACGIARPEPLNLGPLFNQWLDNSFHGPMSFMERYKDLRLDPTKLFPGAKSLIVLSSSYYDESYKPEKPLKVSRYAPGRDYHKVLKKRGQKLIDWMKDQYGGHNARIYVDSAPIMEKEWARRAGLGWIGKNTCLISPGAGSWFFLAVILTDLEILPDAPELRNLCGNCTKCIDVCPTSAIHPDGYLDARKCISCLTIESREQIPSEFDGKTDYWLFGCDLCQEVCPHNRFAKKRILPDFQSREAFKGLKPEKILNMNQEEFDFLFEGTAIKRAGLEKLKKTVIFLFPDV